MVAPNRRAVARSRVRSGLLSAFSSLLGLGLVFVTAGCDKMALTAPSDTTITLVAETTAVPANGVVEITASVIEPAGTPVQNGTLVTFTCCGTQTTSPTPTPTPPPGNGAGGTGGAITPAAEAINSNIGTLEPREAQTHNGKATVRFIAGSFSGTARIGAFSGPARATELQLTVGGANVSSVLVNVSPPSVPATGGTVEIVATVIDAAGNRLAGIPVTFTTTSGTLTQATVSTDGNGEVRTQLSTTRAATVSVAAANRTPVTVNVPLNAVATVALTHAPESPLAGQTVIFTVTPAAGGAPGAGTAGGAAIQNVVIDFGDGTRQELGAITGAVTVAHIYPQAGTFNVTATITDVNGERNITSRAVVVQPRPPLTVTLTAPASALVNERLQFTANVSDLTRVQRFEWDFGDGERATVNSTTIVHHYSTPGLKIVRVTAVTTEGDRFVAQSEIFVNEPPNTGTGGV
jgi:adhesin/invasin